MKDALRSMFGSKKFIAAMANLVVGLVTRIGLDIPVEDVILIMTPLSLYIAGQAAADLGKEAKTS